MTSKSHLKKKQENIFDKEKEGTSVATIIITTSTINYSLSANCTITKNV